MKFDRRRLIVAASLAGLAGYTGLAEPGAATPKTLYRVADPKTILLASRALILKDSIATLITVDPSRQPRARSVLVSPPDDDLTLWIGTRRGSRKLEQLAANPQATVHFNDDEKNSYLSLMGEARAQTDPELLKSKNPYKGDMLRRFFPHFPEDFVLIAFRPQWLELMTDTLPGKPDTWQPQGLAL